MRITERETQSVSLSALPRQPETRYRAGQLETRYRAAQLETRYRAAQLETRYRAGNEAVAGISGEHGCASFASSVDASAGRVAFAGTTKSFATEWCDHSDQPMACGLNAKGSDLTKEVCLG